MFHTALWSSVHSKNTPPLKAIKIWAHLTGVPLDLRYKEGLSLVAGLVGDPKETDDFTLNLVSLTLAHVKVEVDLTKPLPSVVEFESQSGEVVEVSVHYPWVPPTCSHCHELGHIVRNCLLYTPPAEDSTADQGKKNPEPVKHNKKYQSVAKPKQGTYVKKYQLPSKAAAQNPVPMGSESPNINLINNFASLASNEGTPQIVMSSGRFAGSQLLSLPPSSNPFLSPDPPPRPSLKRSRSSPTLSPPLTSQPTPFHQFKTPSKTSQNPLFPFTNSPSLDVLNPRPFNQTLSLTLPPPLPSAPDPTTTSSYVQILAQSNQCITCKIGFPNQAPIIYSAIYASNLSADRIDLWAELIQLQSYLDLENCCWVLGGDFNQILWPSEHSNGHLNTPDSLMYQLQDCLLQFGVFDLRFIGPAHTRTNSQPSNPISKKLDRLLVNPYIVATFPNALASFLPPLISDHAPCILDLAFSLPKAGTQPFKFQNYLTKHPKFAQLINDVWFQAGTSSPKSFSFDIPGRA
ncbi:hypothetical protein F2Q70_00040106 [Brassica cretica]|uniref:Endonuclease/exonuclease/phosphatase domain-containing protein n=1 Tax=Brassica cretica TaxID=69181 RepID=A0A8S9K934_BRACR|nr:hypothetical protein F2Q70_00040106 [Brassica cretica]